MKLLVFAAFLICIVACGPNRQGDVVQKGLTERQLNKHMVNVNKIITDNETEDINNFVKRYGWQLVTTGDGLRYHIYLQGKGVAAIKASTVKLTGKLSLLDGFVCYEYTKANPLTFVVGQLQINNGLEEAIFLMHEGDKIRIIVPSHLGYGLLGDQDQIPPKAVLVYDLELLSVQN